jgi:hypothetical protein
MLWLNRRCQYLNSLSSQSNVKRLVNYFAMAPSQVSVRQVIQSIVNWSIYIAVFLSQIAVRQLSQSNVNSSVNNFAMSQSKVSVSQLSQ